MFGTSGVCVALLSASFQVCKDQNQEQTGQCMEVVHMEWDD